MCVCVRTNTCKEAQRPAAKVQRLRDAGREAPDETETNVVAQGHSLRPEPGKMLDRMKMMRLMAMDNAVVVGMRA